MSLELTEHVVYRCYDASGQLLYIGCTSNLAHRMSLHRHVERSRRWIGLVARTETERFPTRAAGYAAESEAIMLEQPPYNWHLRFAPDTARKGAAWHVVDRRTGRVRFTTEYRNEVDWFMALTKQRRRFIVLPDWFAYTRWTVVRKRRNPNRFAA